MTPNAQHLKMDGLIPLLYLPAVYGISPRVHGWDAAQKQDPFVLHLEIFGSTHDGALMSFRSKVFLSITGTVVLAVWIVAGVVSPQ